MTEKYISISEYAKKTNVSTAAVYKRLKTSLKPFLIEVEGKKFLKSEVLKEEFSTVENGLKPDFDNVVNEVENPKNLNILEEYKDIISILQQQIENKDKQIEKLEQRLEEEKETTSKLLQEANEREQKLLELLQQANTLNQNNQWLLLNQQKKPGLLKRLFASKEVKTEEKQG